MKIIEGLYIAFYRFSNFFRKNVPGSIFYHERFDSIMIMSFLAMFNFSSIWMLLELKPIITTHQFDFFLGFILLGGLNVLYFERKQKYKELIIKYKDESFFFLGWIYGVASIGFFIYFHSRN